MDQGLTAAVTSSPVPPEPVVPEESPHTMPEQVLWSERRADTGPRKRVHLARSALALLWLTGLTAFAWTL